MPSSTCQALLIAAALLSAVAVAGAARPVSTAAVLSSGAVLLAADAEAPVQVTLYAEALCPYCECGPASLLFSGLGMPWSFGSAFP